MMHRAQTTCTGGTGTGSSVVLPVDAMADQGGNVRQALADIARQATCLLQRYENGDVNTIENDIINPLENPTDRTAGASATSSVCTCSNCKYPGVQYKNRCKCVHSSGNGKIAKVNTKNLSPLQLWSQGVLQQSSSCSPAVHGILTDDNTIYHTCKHQTLP